MKDPEIVTEQAALEAHCRAWRAAGCLTFDTEFIRDDTYEAILCLLQVAVGSKVVLIDPTCSLDLGVFWELVTDGAVTTVVHAGKEDFEVCLRVTGRPPRNVFDVQIAAGFVGCGYPLSLSRLVSEVVGHRITKGQTLTDWLRRPLTEAQIRYAVEDVAHLPAVHAQLVDDLARLERAEWAGEEFRRFEDPEFYQPPVGEKLSRLRGTKRLDGLGLVVVERLIEWRERWAQERNRPLRALMRDDVLVEIARRRPKRASDLQVLRGFPQARNRKVVQELLRVIDQARNTPQSEWPQPLKAPREMPMAKVMVDVLSAVTRAVCHEQNLGHELVGGAQRLRELLEYRAGRLKQRPALLCGWREEFIGGRLLDLIDGRNELHVSGWPENPRLEVVTHSAQESIESA